MNLRVPSIALTIAFLSFPAYAQRPGEAGETIQSLSSKVTALTDRVAKLESGRVNAADLAGSYVIRALGLELRHPNPTTISSETSVGSLTLNADGTGSFTVTDARWELKLGFNGSLVYRKTDDSAQFSWVLEDGNVIIPGDEPAVFTVGAGGRVLASGGTSTSGGWANVFLLIRLPNP